MHADMIFPPTKNVPRRPPDSLFGDNSRRVGAWADGNSHAPSEPLRGARQRAVAKRIRATAVGRGGAEVPGGARLRHVRGSRSGIQGEPALPVMRRPESLQGRRQRIRLAAVPLPQLRMPVQLADGNRLGAEQEGPPDLGGLHKADVLERALGGDGGALRHKPPDSLGMAPPGLRDRGRIPGQDRASGQDLDRRDLHQRHGPDPRIRGGQEARPFEAEALHRGRDRRPQEPRRRGLRARQAVDQADEGRAAPAPGGRIGDRA